MVRGSVPGDEDIERDSDAAAKARLLRERLRSGPLQLPVSGASMGSTIKAGSTATVIAADSPRPGEVWAFAGAGSVLLVHRIRHVDGETFTARGDGNRLDDTSLTIDRLVGRVVAATSSGGRRRHFGELDRRWAHFRLAVRKILRPLRRLGRDSH